ncbi:MAG: FAD binding domain-containing protein [Candidatus Cloacimonetes bacterium]
MENHNANDLIKSLQRIYYFNKITFWLNGELITAEIPPAQTTLEFLHNNQHLYGTKCSCNEGDCGACTVVIAQVKEGNIVYEAINSCLYTAAKLHGKHLITIEGLGTLEQLHPIQQVMLENHSLQCGYCSPGFVMSLFALLANISHPDEEEILSALEGNLCRCSSYQSILRAAKELSENFTFNDIVPAWCREIEKQLFSFKDASKLIEKSGNLFYPCTHYFIPQKLSELTDILANTPESVFIAGGTDLMVRMNVQKEEMPVLIDLSELQELKQITYTSRGIVIGAGVTYSDILHSGIIKTDLPSLYELVEKIASKQIRNFATLAGNIANASPIGDTLPLLSVLDASLTLFSSTGIRELPLRDFFLDYRKTRLNYQELIKEIVIPLPTQDAFIRTYKATKRKAVDISAVVSAVKIETESGKIKEAKLAFGGVATIPKLSHKFSELLIGKPSEEINPIEIAEIVSTEFNPISDVRGSKEYRQILIRNQVINYLQEYVQGDTNE